MSSILLSTALLLSAQKQAPETSYLEWELNYWEGEASKKRGEELDIESYYENNRMSFHKIANVKVITRGYQKAFTMAESQGVITGFGIVPSKTDGDIISVYALFRPKDVRRATILSTDISIAKITYNKEKTIGASAMLVEVPGKDSRKGKIKVFTLTIRKRKEENLDVIIRNFQESHFGNRQQKQKGESKVEKK